mgnify:CR=1 FL=1
MRVPNRVQKYLEIVLQCINGSEPIVLSGMYDCGLSYIFYLLRPQLDSKIDSSITPIVFDLSNLTSPEQVFSSVVHAIRVKYPKNINNSSYSSLAESVHSVVGDSKITFVIYAGEEGHVDPDLLLFLQRLRNLLGWRFSYCLFVSCRYLFKSGDSEIVGNIVKQTTVPILLGSDEDSAVVISNYGERLKQKITPTEKKLIITLSGGNPGLIKSLFLQIILHPNLKQPDLYDETLFFRLKEITNDLPLEYIRVILSENIEKEDELIRIVLTRYGYLKEKDGKYLVFSPLFVEYLKTFVQNSTSTISKYSLDIHKVDVYLTKSQRKIYEYMKNHPGKIISRDSMAELLWGGDWTEKYSDWAMDQQLSELRKQLRKIKIDDKIVTKKGEGFVFLPQT